MNKAPQKAKSKAESNNTSSARPDMKDFRDSKQQPAWHVIVLTALTCSMPYIVYWAYKTWRDLKVEANRHQGEETPLSVFRKTNPVLRALSLLVPILNIYFLAVLVSGIAGLHPDKNSFAGKKPLLACFAVVGAFLGILSLSKLPGAFYLLSFLCGIPLAFAQHWLNRYWAETEETGLFVRHAFSIWEMLAIITGAGVIGLVVAGQMIGVKIH